MSLVFLHVHFELLPLAILEAARLPDYVEWSSVHNVLGNERENAMNMKALLTEKFNFSSKETELISRPTLYLSTYDSTAVWDPCVFKYYLGCHLTLIFP